MDLKFYYDKDLPKPTKLKQEYLTNQVSYLKTLPQHEQKSEEWYAMRLTMLSASDWGTILGDNPYSKQDQVLLKKCGQDNFMTNAAMQWGNKYEDVAIAIYEYRNNVKIYDFGCIRHPSLSFLGASPDGISTDGVMLEIKCPTSRQITGIPPKYYWCQVQGQLEVCELDRCDFLECKLKEYENGETEYVNDNFNGDHRYSSNGNEKGVIIELFNKETKSFVYKYSSICIIGDDLDIWKEKMIEKYVNENIILSSFDFWYLEEISCVPIYRNQEWFNEAKIILEEFWLKVLKYRTLGLTILKEDLQQIKDNKKQEKIIIKEEKIKLKEDNKKQRKMKEYITIDDLHQIKDKDNKDNKDKIIEENEEYFNSTTITSFFSN
jgi:putative phage-type endonuclease